MCGCCLRVVLSATPTVRGRLQPRAAAPGGCSAAQGVVVSPLVQVNTETIHRQFVHLGNLPDDGYRELEVVCAGLRFGRVDHYVILKNKNKVNVFCCPLVQNAGLGKKKSESRFLSPSIKNVLLTRDEVSDSFHSSRTRK